ncbi:MAG: glutathione-disulfide reductase [Rhodospirillaceae bacterium]|nr:MAG: glutathione-disulfide reductase [Rhodospirillaceae bacterium]
MVRYDYDLITLGAGSGGVRASRLAGRYGAKVAVIESSRVGGTCVMRGCVPKKLLVYGAHFAAHFEDAVGFGWTVDGARHDWGKMIAAKNKELDRLEGAYNRMLRDANVNVVAGRGVIADPHTVEVDGRPMTAEKLLVSVGGWPVIPDFPGREHVITSNEALDLPERPRRIVIVGGGYIAVEFAGIFAALGSEVTLVIRAGQILRGFDEDVRATLSAELEKQGIRIHRDCLIRSVEKTASGYSVYYDQGEEMVVDCVMFATGRAPNTSRIGLAEVGVKLNDKGAVAVDEWNRSSVDNIFAVGDVTDRVNLTPVAINEGRVFAETFFNKNPMTLDYRNIASAVFSQPPVAVVGLTEAQARIGRQVRVFISRFRPMKHTLSGRQESTMMKLIVDKATDRVLGCHMVGDDAAEIIQGLAVALTCGATKAQFDATVGIHPTAAEEFVTMRDPVPDKEPAAADM